MEHRTRRDLTLRNLITDFEHRYDQGILEFMDEKTLNQLIDHYEKEANFDKAIEVVDIALEQFKYRSEFYIAKARLLINDNQVDRGIEWLESAELIAPYEREIVILKIKAYSVKKQFDRAEQLISDIKGFAVKDDLVDILIAESYYFEHLRDYHGMYAVLKDCLRIDYTNSEALDRFVLAVELSKNFKDSISFNAALIDADPYNHLAWYNIGLSYYGVWEYEKAIEALEYSFIIDPNFEQGYMECAEVCLQEKLYQKALEIYKDVDERFGPDQDVMINIATCYMKLDQVLDAKIVLLKALKMDAHNDEIYFLLGECFALNNNWYSAINAYLKAIEIDSEREEYYLALAKSYVSVEEYNKATINFNRACQICNEESLYWKEYACFIIKMGLYKEALLILDEAEDNTFGPDLLYCRAITLFFMKKKKQGLKILIEALQEDFSQHRIIFELAPELEIDQEINAMIKYYGIEAEEESL